MREEVRLRIVIHDFVGHAFQVQLSRELARRGHRVLHVYLAGFQTPKGRLVKDESDPEGLELVPIVLSGEYPKYQYLRRYVADTRYTSELLHKAEQFKPDVILSGNASPLIQRRILRYCRSRRMRFVNWVQDCYWMAAERLGSGVGVLTSRVLARYLRRIETKIIGAADCSVLISEDFCNAFPGVSRPNITIIENWAPIDDIPVRPKKNAWSVGKGIADKRVLLYSGTRGLKHHPDLLVRLASHFRSESGVVVVVVSEGVGRRYLEARKRELKLANLMLFDFEEFDRFPDVVAAGDVLLAMVEKEASAFSVPSKVLSYLCGQRPLLLAVPGANLAARVVKASRSGIVVEPDDAESWVLGAERLLWDTDLALALARNGRSYAEVTFDIRRIGDRFENVVDGRW